MNHTSTHLQLAPRKRLFPLRKVFFFLLLIFVSVLYLGPFVWMVSTSFKTAKEAGADDPSILCPLASQDQLGLAARHISPNAPGIVQRYQIAHGNYEKVLTDPAFDFILYARNTLVIALAVVLGSVFSSSLVAYSLAKLHWRGRNLVFGLVLTTMMLPFTVFMIPQYLIFKNLHIIGTNIPLWAPSFFGGSFYIFLLRQFYLTIPDELLAAARIDGCSEFRIWWSIILPLSKPALSVVALFSFMAAWNDFLGPLVYLSHRQNFTLSLALQFFQSRSGGTTWELLMAASVLVIIPILALFFMAQKTFVQGIATTGMKG